MNKKNNTEQQNRKKVKSLPRDINAAIKSVIDIIKQLGEVYSEENKALKQADTKKFMALQEKKISATHEYQTIMAQMIARKNDLNKADPEMKDRLKKLHNNFSTISKENMRSIERMQRCTERLGNTIRSAAVRSAHNTRGYSYGETGAISNISRKKAVSSGLSETV